MLPSICLLPAGVVCLVQAPAPAIHFEATHHDFGTLVSNARKSGHRYRVANVGSAPLRLKSVQTSCGCSVASVGQRELRPGEETFIEVLFDPRGLKGNVHKALEVRSNDPLEPSSRLSFEATVVPAILPSTDACRLGTAGSAKESASIRLRSMDGRPVGVRRAEVRDAPHIACTHSMDGQDAILKVTMDGGLVPKSTYSGVALLRVQTDSRSCPRFDFPIKWEAPAPVAATPDRVTLSGNAGAELRANIIVGSRDGAAFRILRALPSSPLLSVEGLGRGGSTSHALEIVFSKNAKARGYSEKLVLRLDHPEQPTLEIDVAAVIR